MHTHIHAHKLASTHSALGHRWAQPKSSYILYLHPSAPLFLLESFNLNSACFPPCGEHRSLSCSPPLRYYPSAALLLLGSFFSFHPPFLCLKDKRLHLIHPCVCPPVPENDTTPMLLVKLVSYGGGQGSVAVLSPLQLAAPCWCQWEMPGRQRTGVKCPVKVC